jgi:hypothetical protein
VAEGMIDGGELHRIGTCSMRHMVSQGGFFFVQNSSATSTKAEAESLHRIKKGERRLMVVTRNSNKRIYRGGRVGGGARGKKQRGHRSPKMKSRLRVRK